MLSALTHRNRLYQQVYTVYIEVVTTSIECTLSLKPTDNFIKNEIKLILAGLLATRIPYLCDQIF